VNPLYVHPVAGVFIAMLLVDDGSNSDSVFAMVNITVGGGMGEMQ